MHSYPDRPGPARLELGCGDHKRAGFFGIDICQGKDVDLVHDIEIDPLPFGSDSVDYIYSSHAFEHLEKPGSPIQTLREIVRVAKHGATVEIWTPYGKSNDGMLFGHRNFYTESHWQHICVLYDDFYLGKGVPGRLIWERSQYVLTGGAMEDLASHGIPIELALKFMFNVAAEWGVFLRVDKTLIKAPNPQIPINEYCYERDRPLAPPKVRDPMGAPLRLTPEPPSAPQQPLRRVLSNELKRRFPALHSLTKAAANALR